jgi:hypothetical protein
MSVRERRALVAFGGLVLAAVVAAVLLYATSGSSPARPTAIAPIAPVATARFPAPPAGSVVLAREDGPDVLAIAIPPSASGSAQLSVVGPQGTGVDGLHVSLATARASGVTTSTATACGHGCYRAALGSGSTPRTVRVRVVRAAGTTVWNVPLPASSPAPNASAIVARATRVWTGLSSISYLDRLGSDGSHIVVAHWQIVAPDRLAYQIQQGGQAVIIGLKRWDRQAAGGAWQESAAIRLHQPEPFWVSATDAHVLGSGTFGGHAVWHVSFFDPRTPGWFLASIDKRSARTLDLHMFAAAHFMHDTYGQFDAPIKILPPSSGE